MKPKVWKRYVDDTNVIWNHGNGELDKFIQHLNKQLDVIQFTLEMEENGRISFLDIKLTKRLDETLSHQVYRKLTHTEQYLHADSYHHPSQKLGVIKTLATRALRISDKEHLDQEREHLIQGFKNNGYKEKHINTILRKNNPKNNTWKSNEKNEKNKKDRSLTLVLPFIQGVTNKIANILRKKDIKTFFRPTSTIKSLLKSVKDLIHPHQFKGVYEIPCSCGKSYIGETGKSFKQRIKEHGADLRLNRCHTSALVKHANKTKHQLCLENTNILSKEENYSKRKFREALEIIKHPQNLNRDNGWEISRSWIPLLHQNLNNDYKEKHH